MVAVCASTFVPGQDLLSVFMTLIYWVIVICPIGYCTAHTWLITLALANLCLSRTLQ